MRKTMDKIKEAAIKHIPTNNVVTGRNHSECIKKFYELLPLIGGDLKTQNILQGFVTYDMRFVDRETAAKIALASGQIKKLKFSSTKLFSEDLY